jgi:hypothetical protein
MTIALPVFGRERRAAGRAVFLLDAVAMVAP